jgi:hypothetical protein
VIYSSTDRFMIALFLDERSVGAYHAAFGLADRTLDLLFIWIGLAGWPAAIAALERDGIPPCARSPPTSSSCWPSSPFPPRLAWPPSPARFQR